MGAFGRPHARHLSRGGGQLTAIALPGRVALVHDWLTGMRGGEKALEPICALAPGADLYTLLHVPGSVSPTIERRPIHTSFIQHLPEARRRYRHYLPLFPAAIERLKVAPVDVVLSFSHAVAKSIVVPPGVPHLCYCFTPMRYAWDQFDAYFGPERVGPLRSALLKPVLAHLARWDRRTASRPTRYLAISQYVANRIHRYYDRQATIVYPPVDTEFYRPDQTRPGPHFLVVSALVPYKRIDVAIDACARIGASLRIVGEGPERARLEAMAGPGVEFLGWRSDEEVRAEYRRAAAVLLPGEEDFGIVPVEAQACGRPVVALGKGGALETVLEGVSGVFATEPTGPAFAAALERVATLQIDVNRVRAHAERFSTARYVEAFTTAVHETVHAPAGTRW